MKRVFFYITNGIDLKFTKNWLGQTSAIDTAHSGLIQYRMGGENALVPRENVVTELPLFEIAFDKPTSIDYEFLKTWESQFEDWPIWKIIESNRFLSMNFDNGILKDYQKRFSDEIALKFTELLLKEIVALFDRLKPEVLIYGGNDTAPFSSLLTFLVAKSKGIKIIVPQFMRLLPRNHLTNTIFNVWPQLDENIKINEESKQLAKKYFDKICSGHEIYDANKVYFANKNSFVKRFRSFLFIVKVNWKKGLKKDLYNNHNPIVHFYNNEFRKYKEYNWLIKANFFELAFPNYKYAYFPLHIEPEMSTLFYAPHYKNQIEIAAQVAMSLPVDVKLVVKDHAAWLSRRNREYYKMLKGLNNVVLIDPTIDSKTLIRNAQFLVAITGTAAFEAALIGKHVVSFGTSYFTKHLSFIHSVRNNEELPALLKKLLSEDFQIENNALSVLEKAIQVSDVPELGLATRNYNSENRTDIFVRYAKKIESILQ